MPRSIDDEVMGQFHGLIGNMRAKRLSSLLPKADEPKVNDEAEGPTDADADYEALESMLADQAAEKDDTDGDAARV